MVNLNLEKLLSINNFVIEFLKHQAQYEATIVLNNLIKKSSHCMSKKSF